MAATKARGGGQFVKMWYRIGEAASLVGEKPHVLRYWETEFRALRPQKSAKGQRVYSRRDIETLQKVRHLLKDQRFTIEGAKKKLREGGIEPPEPVEERASAALGSAHLRDALRDVRGEVAAFLARLEHEA